MFWNTDARQIGRGEYFPIEELEYLDLMYELPKSFYTRSEYSKYIVRRYKLLRVIEEST